MTTREERIKEIIRAKEEKVKARYMKQGMARIRKALGHIEQGVKELDSSSEFFATAGFYKGYGTPLTDSLEKSRRLLADAISELVQYNK